MRSAAEAIIACTPEGVIMAWNPAAERLYGYGADEAVGSSIERLWPAGRRVQAQALFALALKGTRTGEVEMERVDKGGRSLLVSLNLGPVHDRAGAVIGVTAIARDVSTQARDHERLARSEAQLEEAQALAGVGSWVFDLDTRQVTWSRGFFRIAGRDPGTFTPTAETVGAMLSFGRDDPVGALVLESIERRRPFALACRLARSDGTTALIQLRGRTVPSRDGLRGWLVGGVVDVTESERAKEALRTAEARLCAVVDAMPAIVFLKDLDGAYSLGNRRFGELVGRSAPEFIGQTDAALFPAETAAQLRANDQVVLGGNAPATFEEALDTGDRRRVWETRKFPLTDASGRPIAIGGVAVEVTERRRELDELTRSRELLTEAQRIGRVGSWTWDAAHNEAAWSPEHFRIYGLPATSGPLPAQHAFDLIHPDDREMVDQTLAGALAGGGPFSLVHRVVRPDGAVVDVHLRGETVPGSTLMMGTSQDVTAEHTARRRLEATLRVLRETDADRRRLLKHVVTAQEDERRRIAADIHDESVQAMSAVSLRLEALAASLEDEQARAGLDDLSDIVVAAIGRLRTLLFELAPPELGHGGALAVLGALLEEFTADTGIAYELEGDLDAEPSLRVQALVYRIAQEALANVRRHARATTVRASLAHTGSHLELELEDDGVGFDPEAVSQRPGHMGLVAMRRRAELAGGTLEVMAAPGAGVRIRARIAADPAEAEA